MAIELASAYIQIIPSVRGISSDLSGSLSGLMTDANNAESALNNLGDTTAITGSDLDSFGSDASSAGSDLNDLGSDADGLGGDLDGLGADASDAGSDLNGLENDASDVGSELDNLASSADDSASSIGSLGDAASGALGDVGDLGLSLGGIVSSGSSDASAAMEGVSNVVGELAKGDFAGAAVSAVTSIGKGIYSMATESQDASAIIAQGTGATGDELEDMEKRAQSALGGVALASKTNLGDVSTTLAEINTRFGYTGDELEDATVLMTDFASITGQDGASAVDAIADTMNHWHLESEDMPGLLDDITAASQASGESAQNLETALADNSAAFQELGMDLDDSLAFLAAYSQSGGDASDATAILKSAVSNLSGEVDDVPGTFQAAIDTIANADDASDALTSTVGDTGLTVEDVFGTKSANKMIEAVQSEQFSIEDMISVLEEDDGAMEQTASNSETFNDKVQSAFNSAKEGVRTAGDVIGKVVTGDLSGAFEEIGNTKVGQKISSAFSTSKTGVSTACEKIKTSLSNLTSKMKSTGEKSEETGKELANGVDSGFSGKWGGIAEKITGKVTGLLGNINSKLEVGSPSKVWAKTGGFMAEGLGVGYDEEFKNVQKDIVGSVDDLSVDVNGTGAAASGSALDVILTLLQAYLPQLANLQVVMDSGTVVGELAASMDKALGKIEAQKARGMA